MIYDAEYFKNRKLEKKHFFDVLLWDNYFKPKKMLLVGDGMGHRTFAASVTGMDVIGCDLKGVFENTPHDIKDRYVEGDVKQLPFKENEFDLVIGYDILEHLENIKDVENALKELYRVTNKHVLIAIPDIDNPNLYNDETHHIYKSMGWWIWMVRCANFKIIKTPENFIFREQIIVGEKRC